MLATDVLIAVVNRSKSLDDTSVEFMVAAVAAQVQECAAAWGVPPLAVAFYADPAKLLQDDIYVCSIVDELDVDGALGFHSVLGDRPFIEVLAQGEQTSVTLSHEALETLCDPDADQWRARGDGMQVALEVCDPVEGDSYFLTAEVASEARAVRVSNYVLPAWFDPAAPRGTQVDRMIKVGLPFTMDAGGYMVVLDAAGTESDVFFGSMAAAGRTMKALARKSGSRLLRRLRGRQ